MGIDTVYVDFRRRRLERIAGARGATDSSGRLAIHPDQVAVINRAYTPSHAEIEHARKIVAAFEADPGAGALGIDGRMVDIPHLKAARKTLSSM